MTDRNALYSSLYSFWQPGLKLIWVRSGTTHLLRACARQPAVSCAALHLYNCMPTHFSPVRSLRRGEGMTAEATCKHTVVCYLVS